MWLAEQMWWLIVSYGKSSFSSYTFGVNVETNVHKQCDAYAWQRRGLARTIEEVEEETEWHTSFLIKPIDQLTRPFISSAHLY